MITFVYVILITSSQWRHNGHDSISNHQSHHCLLNYLFRRRSKKKNQSSASLAFVCGIHRGPVNSPHKWPVTREMLPFDDVIMYIPHGCLINTRRIMLIYIRVGELSWYITSSFDDEQQRSQTGRPAIWVIWINAIKEIWVNASGATVSINHNGTDRVMT